MAEKKPVSAEVQAATAKLRTYHRLGTQLLKKRESDSRRWADLQAVCEQSGVPVHQIRTLRAFAAKYTELDLTRLFRQCEQHNRAIGLTAIRHLVKFDDKRQRAQFQSRLIAGAWSNSEIVARLKRELRPSWKGGRKPTIAEDVPGVLLQLEGFAIAWRRWSGRLADQNDKGVKIRLTDLPREVRAAMEGVTGAFEAISAAVAQPQNGAGGENPTVQSKRSKDGTQGKQL